MFRKILVPVDGSSTSLRACEAAAELARAHQAEVTLLVVSDPVKVAEMTAPEPLQALLTESVREANQRILTEASERFQDSERAVTQVERHGRVPSAIAQEAAEGQFDLIVMGSRGLGLGDEELGLLGSVTEGVLRRARCPILVVKQ
jgi:nucleotide-binding universal stress UspA family protein